MDTLEQVVSETLRDAARDAPAPTGVPANPRPKRRRGNLGALLVAVTALVVVAGGVGLYAYVHDTSSDGGIDRVARPEAETLVGFGDLAMPLPGGWAIGDYRCGQPQSNTVDIQPSGAVRGCLASRAPGASDVQIDDLRGPLARRWSDIATHDVSLADGTRALIGAAPGLALLGTDSVPVKNYTTTVVVVPDLDAILVGSSPDGRPLDDILLAAGRMPSDRAAVPKLQGLPRAAAAAALDRAGLEADFQRVPYSVKGVVADSEPEPGQVVPVGSTIHVGVGR